MPAGKSGWQHHDAMMWEKETGQTRWEDAWSLLWEWPSQSPKAVENLWAEFKCNVHSCCPSSETGDNSVPSFHSHLFTALHCSRRWNLRKIPCRLWLQLNKVWKNFKSCELFFFFLQSTANPAGRTELIAKPKLMKPLTACALFTGRALLSCIHLFALQLSAGLMIWASLCLCEFGLPFLLSFFLLREMSVKKKKKRGRALLQPTWYQLFKCFPSPEEDTPLPVFLSSSHVLQRACFMSECSDPNSQKTKPHTLEPRI